MKEQDDALTDDMTDDMTYIAVFGDIHGRVALMYTLAHVWQQETGQHLQLLLQVGDMGAFPDHARLDRATLSHAKRDPDELDFVLFSEPTVEGAHYLDRPEAPPTLFIRGNHEDFDYLGQFSGVRAVDPWGKLRYLEDGASIAFSRASMQAELTGVAACHHPSPLVVGGFGGIEPPERGRGKKARTAHRKAKGRVDRDKYFEPSDISTSFLDAPPLDVLMTHEGPACDAFPQGSYMLGELARRLCPGWHFFGHHHAVVGPVAGPGDSMLVGLEHLDFDRSGRMQDDAWGILAWSSVPERRAFTFANHQTMPWLKEIRRHSYRGYL